MNQNVENIASAPGANAEDRLAAAAQESRDAWRRLGMRLRGLTPAGLARLVLIVGALVTLTWVLAATLRPLLPFVIGLVLAYITAPLVEGLDRVMPRTLAVLLVIIGEILLSLLVVAVLIFPLARELMQVVENLPSAEQLRGMIEDLVAHLRTLPEPTQEFIRDGLRRAAVQVRDNLAVYFQRATDIGIGALFRLLRTFSFVIGLVVLPTWLYSVVSAQKEARQALDEALPEWARADFWAMVRIVDRTLSAALRGLALQGIAVGTTTYLGLALLERFGVPSLEYQLLAAVLAGLMELLPDVGPFLWAVPAGLIGFSTSTEMGVGLLGVYLVGRWLVHRLFVSRVEERVTRGVHPAFVIVAIVALSEFGLLWLFLAAPLVTIARDLFRYAYGRLREPPRPAGLLPDEPLPVAETPMAIPARQASRRRSRRSPPGEAQQSAPRMGLSR